MAISIIGTNQGGSAINGGNVTLTFSTTPNNPATGDHIYIFGGSFTRAGINYGNTGYTSIINDTTSIANYTIVVQRLVVGASPPTTVVCNGTGNASDATAYCSIVVRGASTLFDATTVTATGSSTNPNAGAITTNLDNDVVMIMAASAVNDTSITAPTNYATNAISASGNDTNNLSAALAFRAIAAGGTNEDPASWTTWSTGAWVAYTIALKLAAAAKTIPTATAKNNVTNTKLVTAARAVSLMKLAQLVQSGKTRFLPATKTTAPIASFVLLSGTTALLRSVAGGTIGEIVSLLKAINKNILLSSAQVVTALKFTTKTILLTGQQLLNFTATKTSGGTTNPLTITISSSYFLLLSGTATLLRSVAGGTIGEIVTLSKSVSKIITLLSGELISLLRNMSKTILLFSAELVTLVATSSTPQKTKTVTLSSPELLTLLKTTNKIISLFSNELITLLKTTSKTISLTLRQTVTLLKSAGKLINLTLRETVTLLKSNAKLITLSSNELVTLLKSTTKTFLLSSAELVTLIKSTAKTIRINSGELVTLVKSQLKIINLTSSQVVTLLHALGKIILLFSAQLIALPRTIGKTILITLSEFLSVVPVGSGRRPITILSGELVTLGKASTKTILVSLAEFLSLQKFFARTLLLTSPMFLLLSGTATLFRSIAGGSISEIVTVIAHGTAQKITILINSLEVVSLLAKGSRVVQIITTFINQITSLFGQSHVFQLPIKIIPLDYQYQLPFSYTKPPTNPIYVDDSATLFMVPDEPMRSVDRIILTITAPDGSTETRLYPKVWIGGLDSWGSDDNFATSSLNFAITQFTIGQLNQSGFWRVVLTYKGVTVHSGQFFIAIRPANIPAPIPLPGVTFFVSGHSLGDILTDDVGVPLTDDSGNYLTA